ncbi:hypothetical protein Bbelb_201730 [Branchiostoma belcheri]|nr:hypothetical protein Bbelb_201730 [Branchiostoma belcheri]
MFPDRAARRRHCRAQCGRDEGRNLEPRQAAKSLDCSMVGQTGITSGAFKRLSSASYCVLRCRSSPILASGSRSVAGAPEVQQNARGAGTSADYVSPSTTTPRADRPAKKQDIQGTKWPRSNADDSMSFSQ